MTSGARVSGSLHLDEAIDALTQIRVIVYGLTFGTGFTPFSIPASFAIFVEQTSD